MFQSDSEEEDSLIIGDIIQGRFEIHSKIGYGSFGQVYKVIDQKYGNTPYAMKVEFTNQECNLLEKEIKVLIDLRKKVGFPEIKFYGKEKRFTFCVMNILGKNLESVIRKCGGSFSLQTVLRLAIQMIERIEALHSCKYLHRDLKPDNFVLENTTSPKIINLIDFGLSKKYANSKGDHIKLIKKPGLIGTARYASINAHESFEQGRRDDLQSLGYVLLYLLTGHLPWMNVKIEMKNLKYAKIHQMKKNMKLEQLFSKQPKCFIKFMQDVQTLDFAQQPNYKQLKGHFQDELSQLSLNFLNYGFDWEKLPEYSSKKKKHQTIAIMNSSGRDEIMNIQFQKFDPNKHEQLLRKSTKKLDNKPFLINVAEPSEHQKQLDVQPQHISGNPFLQIPQYNSCTKIDQLSSLNQSNHTSKTNNYLQSDDVMSEELLPNIEMKESSLPGFKKMIDYEMIGIKKPQVLNKKTSQMDTIRIMQQNFFKPQVIKDEEENPELELSD
ncbi:unnamed protein product (macronuclear) [Paramecium tetraurelia]|uniref:Casein kinase I n=1 Tax=Paramecium tetraurelia TaxID=5888 RepID=A0EID8_PARTE|nr:uncharacterized protein GSPATT00027408001 [Paramecium tetraurelia]CAK95079.1 unnamed protein product [Paramecium tetraurelia]|eukprot:XP_001462452.1 hypothetical protein (macronuclear) [Paramecium tetraurelia strain d4-2]